MAEGTLDASRYVSINYGPDSGVTYSFDTASSKSAGPIRVEHVDTRRTVDLTLENSPYQVKAWEDEEGVRWVQIGCKKATLARWRERGTRFIGAHSKAGKEQARLAAGLKLVLAAVEKALA